MEVGVPMPWIDIAFFVILIIAAIIGCYKGFLQSVVALCGTLLTLVLSIWLSKPANGLLESWFGLNSALGSALYDTIAGYCQGDSLSFLLDQLAKLLLGADYVEVYGSISSPEFITAFSNAIGELIGILITVAILFIIIKLIIFLLSKLFDVITKNRAINGLDRVLGFVIGAAEGFLFCFVVLGICYLLGGMIPAFGNWIGDMQALNPVVNEVYKWASELLENTIIPFFTG